MGSFKHWTKWQRFLVTSFDGELLKTNKTLTTLDLNNNNITYAELKGNTSHMVNILNDFRNSKIKVILLNTLYAGSGIDISFATDVIIYHQMGLHKNQAIGRAQRVGRVNQLYIHNLCYEQEMP